VNQIIEREILEQWGYDVILANNGAEAVDSMRRKADIAIVLMDIHMPVMDGYEAARKIREFNKDVPIIAMTAASFANDKQKCVEVGMTGYVTKPVDPSKLFEEIKLQVHGDVTYTSHVDTKKTIEQRVEDCDVNNYLDIKQGLKQIGNNKKLYYEVLEKYYRDILDDREKISLLIKNKAYDEAHKLVHKINGCSGNIGGLKLFQSSKMLIDAMSLGIEVDIGPYLWEFESDFEHTLEVIKCILNEITEDQEEKEMNKELEQHTKEVEEMINQLEELLLKADLDAFIVYEQIKSKISMNDIIWSEVDMYMKKYDFDNAYRALKKYK
jgi:two-component system sensor histidine kinase/response regulator